LSSEDDRRVDRLWIVLMGTKERKGLLAVFCECVCALAWLLRRHIIHLVSDLGVVWCNMIAPVNPSDYFDGFILKRCYSFEIFNA